jgi:predicted nucleotidyltransferase
MKKWPARIQKEYAPVVKEIVGILKEKYEANLVSAVLYGSVARGRAGKSSDIDICLIFQTLPPATHKRTAYVTAFEDDLRARESFSKLFDEGYCVSVSPVEFTVEELKLRTPALFLDLLEDGVVLIDDGTFERKAGQLRHRMAELGTHKIPLEDGGHTWALKKDARPGEAISI